MGKVAFLQADALLVIDMQVGFLERTNDFISRIETLVANFPPEKTFWLKYRNEPDSLYHKYLDWKDVMVAPQTELAPQFNPPPDRIFEHYTYTPSQILLDRLEGCKEVAIAGVDTDACVFATAFALWDRNIRPLILENYCTSSGGQYLHKAALDIMRRQFGIGSIISPRL
jgi:nicotinamidase-related amidase